MASDADQPLADVDPDNVVKSLGERSRVTARPAAGIQDPGSTRG
jgi:hypothetical protein